MLLPPTDALAVAASDEAAAANRFAISPSQPESRREDERSTPWSLAVPGPVTRFSSMLGARLGSGGE
jgi:hypothetical protein